VAMKEISSLDKMECVDNLCYLGDFIGAAGAEEASRASVRCARAKFGELSPVSIHGGQVANALACNAGCHGFVPQLRRLF